MFEHLARRFAEVLTKGEVFELFRMLEQRYGTISRVCERIGIERRTFYHWKYAKQINRETKFKVLEAALEEHPIDTLEFLARRSRGRTKEVLELLLEFLRRDVLEEEDPRRAREFAKKAEEVINEFSIPITEYLHHEIAELIEAAYSRGLEIRVKPYISTQLLTIMPRTFPEEYEQPSLKTYTEALASTTGTVSVSETPQVAPVVRSPESLERWGRWTTQ